MGQKKFFIGAIIVFAVLGQGCTILRAKGELIQFGQPKSGIFALPDGEVLVGDQVRIFETTCHDAYGRDAIVRKRCQKRQVGFGKVTAVTSGRSVVVETLGNLSLSVSSEIAVLR